MKNDGLAALRSPTIEFEANAGELVFLWIGITGAGFRTYTIDDFRSASEGMACVRQAAYSVRAGQ